MSKLYLFDTDTDQFLNKVGGWTQALERARYFTSYGAADRVRDQHDRNLIILGEDDARRVFTPGEES